MKLSHAGPMTLDNRRLPGKPEALPGVGSSDLVPQFTLHHSTFSAYFCPNLR
jgi:hypothetical protein